jgi:hypothetical protein
MLPASAEGGVTVREVYQLVQAVRAELMAELSKIEAKMTAQIAAHDTEHQRDRDLRSSRIKWAVTTIISILVGLVA